MPSVCMARYREVKENPYLEEFATQGLILQTCMYRSIFTHMNSATAGNIININNATPLHVCRIDHQIRHSIERLKTSHQEQDPDFIEDNS